MGNLTPEEIARNGAINAENIAKQAGEQAKDYGKRQWYPSVDADGNLEWEKSKSDAKPRATNIRGPQGTSGIMGEVPDLTVVNSLDGGESEPGSVKVLAAEQGKILKEKIEEQKVEVDAARDSAIASIKENEQSAITNFNAQKVTPEMLSESTKQLIEASGGGTITNLADDEDIKSVDDGTGSNVLKFADRSYNAENFSGKGYKILRKNIVDGKNLLTQNMLNDSNTVYEIRYDFDLNGVTLIIPDNCLLKFNGGSISNGVLNGNNTKIQVIGTYEIFNNILLKNSWCGYISDLYFHYSGKQHYDIISSLLKFETVEFSRSVYYVERWETIMMNIGNIRIKGNNTTFLVTKDKGTYHSSQWGDTYDVYKLFTNEGANYDATIRIEGINIIDNLSVSNDESFGEDISIYRKYSYFAFFGKSLHLDNVKSDGGGELFNIYNIRYKMDYIKLNNCRIKTNQFVIEIANLTHESYPEYSGTCEEVIITNSYLYQYKLNPYVGIISLAGTNLIKKATITFNYIDCTENAGNFEVFGCEQVYVTNNIMINQFLCSEEHENNNYYYSINNTFLFTSTDNTAYKFGFKYISFISNYLQFNNDSNYVIYNFNNLKSLIFTQNIIDVSGYATQKECIHLSKVSVLKAQSVIKDNKILNLKYIAKSPLIRYPYVSNIEEKETIGIKNYYGYSYVIPKINSADISLDDNEYTKNVGESFAISNPNNLDEKSFSISYIGYYTNKNKKETIAEFTIVDDVFNIFKEYSTIRIYKNEELLVSENIVNYILKNETFRLDIIFSQYHSDKKLNIIILINKEQKSYIETDYENDICSFEYVTSYTTEEFKYSRVGLLRGSYYV